MSRTGQATAEDDGGDHGAGQPWVACARRRHLIAADPLGPVVAHGFREAPGYDPRLIDNELRRFLRHASLQLVPVTNGVFWSDVTLPSPDPSREDIEHLIAGAIRFAGKRVPAAVKVASRRELREDGSSTRRVWDIAFRHELVRLSPGRCQLHVESGRTAGAALTCRLPDGDAELSFDRFLLSDEMAVEKAVELTGVPAVSADVQRLYVVGAARAAAAVARYQVVHSDGRVEKLTALDGAGNILTSGSNERPFWFNGYDLDYLGGVKKLFAPIQPGFGQTTALDTADFDEAKQNCPPADVPANEKYNRGFVVCGNDIFLESSQPVASPRSDSDFTNPPGLGADPLGPQLMLMNQDLVDAPLVHGTLSDITARPRPSVLLPGYARTGNPAEQPIGPAHHAELQLFYTIGKLQQFYAPIDARFRVGGQDRFRTTLRVHWRGKASAEEPADENISARAGRFGIKVSDWSPQVVFGVPQLESYALDGTSDGSIMAHEYQHHIQESLAVDDGWTLLPQQSVLFPDPTPENLCKAPNEANCRRAQILEGAADGFASLAVDRGVLGTLAGSKRPVADMLGLCDNDSAYGDMVIPETLGARVVCTNRVFGYWHEGPTTGPAPCARADNEGKKLQYGNERRAVSSGALFAYQRRFLDAGIGPFTPALHMTEGQRALQEITDNEIMLREGVIEYLRAASSAAVRRYEYTARAAFAEKGVFSPLTHYITMVATGGDIDTRPIVRCVAPGCTPELAQIVSAQTLTMSGPFVWSSQTSAPRFDVFAPPGSAFETSLARGEPNIVHIELSDNPTFNAALGVVNETVRSFSPTARVNCAPPGFFRTPPGNAQWQAVAASALTKSGRVYYRARQCLAGSTPCISSAIPGVPAYVVLDLSPGGCAPGQCGASDPSGRTSWPSALLGLALAGVLRRRLRPQR